MKNLSMLFLWVILLFLVIGPLVSRAAAPGPFQIYSADSSNSIRLQLATQLRATLEGGAPAAGENRQYDLTMKARRIRPTITGKLYDGRLSFKLHLSTAPNSLELMDLYFDYRYRPDIRFRYGQYKVPLTRYRIQSWSRLTLVDWAIVNKFFGAERQMGFALHNGYERPGRWGYVLGVFSGVNARASHGTGVARLYGEDFPNPSDLADPGSSGKFHPELFLHLSHNANAINVISDSDPDRGDLRYSLAFSVARDFDPTPYQDFSLRLAPEFLIKYRGFSCAGIGYAGYIEIGDSSDYQPAMTGALVQAAYRLTPRIELAGRYAIVSFNEDARSDAHARAQDIIAETAAKPELTANNMSALTAYDMAGLTTQEEEFRLGLNVYFMEHSLKMQIDGGCLRHTVLSNKTTDVDMRWQFQLAF